jgi:DNA-binding CsgD family transcriptional regulator
MTQPAVQVHLHTRLRVAVLSEDPVRRAELERIVAQAGHELVEPTEAQAVLLEGVPEPPDRPAVTLGVSDADQAAVLPHDASASQIDAALRAVAAGLIVRVRSDHSRGFDTPPPRHAHPLLTPREVEILAAIGAGLSNKAIARRFAISQHTVKFHVESLFRKLGVRTRAEAVARATERRRDETVEV